ncbi:MAG: TonB-dependent receptor [Acidobacteriaceae bacterium]
MAQRTFSAAGFSACLFFGVTASLLAQTGRSGTVSGLVTSADREPVPGAVVTLQGADGFQRVNNTTAAGEFSLVEIPSGTYVVRASSPGFAATTQPNVSVAVGRNTRLSLTLGMAGATESVSVTAHQPALDASQTSSVVNIDRDRVEELPIPSRNYLTFVLLSPQAAPANPAVAQQTGAQAEGGFGFGGLRPSSNAIRLDGVSDDDEFSGSSRTQLSPEAISDFQVVNHGFSAESGGAAGGSIDVQTRMGLNRVHGDAFLFEQNGVWNGTPPLALFASKPKENRLRAGVALGGALQRDKSFYYAAAEQEIAHGEDANDLKPATVRQIDAALQQPGPVQGLQLHAGVFPTTTQETELSGRLDRVLTTRHSAMLRYAFTNARNGADAFSTDELTDLSARGSAFTADHSVNGSLTSTFTPGFLNTFRFELAQRRAVQRTGSTLLPGVLIPGVASFGTPFFGNSRRFETHVEVEESAAVQLRRHLIQAGGGVDRVDLRSAILDGSRGMYVFPSLSTLSEAAPEFFLQTFYSRPNTSFVTYRSKGYVQDHWTATQKLVLDYGLRYEDNHLPGSLPQHPWNFSPRVGVAYRPADSLVIRSGFGIFYDRFLLSTVNRLLQLDGSRGFSQMLDGTAATALYRTHQPLTQPLASIAPSVWTARSGLHNPYSEVASVSAEEVLPLQTTLKAEYQFVHGVHLGRTTNVNLTPPVILSTQNAASLGATVSASQPAGALIFSPARIDPSYDAVNQFSTTASSSYNGATVTLNRQFTDDFQLLAGYTYSKTIDDASFDTEQPQNPYNLRGERAPSLQDQRHRLTLSGLWLLGPDLNDPQDAVANAHPGPLMRLLTGFEFAPILSVTSGFRSDAITGSDSNREHVFPFAARPAGFTRNSLKTAPAIDVDLRVLKMVALGPGHLDLVAESFNLLNHRNASLLSNAFGPDVAPQVSFGRTIATSAARKVQISLDYEF